MNNQFDYRCPKCRATDQIDICAKVWIRLTEDGTDADASENGEHHWDDSSPAECGSCSYQGQVSEFDPDAVTEEGGAA